MDEPPRSGTRGATTVPFVDINLYPVEPALVRRIPEDLARFFRVVLLKEDAEGVLLGMVDPSDLNAINQISPFFKGRIALARVDAVALSGLTERIFRRGNDIDRLAKNLQDEIVFKDLQDEEEEDRSSTSETTVAQLLQNIIEEAVMLRASDIHLEPEEKLLRIRYRVDGTLQEHILHRQEIAANLISRLKLVAGLDISNKRLPQDGRFTYTLHEKRIDIRLATSPTFFGEAAVMRILDQSEQLFRLDRIGIPQAMLYRFRRLIRKPYGIIFVTGPTGSGKTTTLYAALSELNSPGRKLFSVEDPVEFILPRITQIQVNEGIDLTFHRVLRSILRQDPDIILIGEIRDRQTAEVSVRAAMTGHLVFSTLHTNDAPSTVLRLIDMGVESYKISSTLVGILAQRLIRKICPSCRVETRLTDRQAVLFRALSDLPLDERVFYRGQGCSHCYDTGYRGRLAVFELLEISGPMSEAMRTNDLRGFSRLASEAADYVPLVKMALHYAMTGETTMDEVLGLSREAEPEDVWLETDPVPPISPA